MPRRRSTPRRKPPSSLPQIAWGVLVAGLFAALAIHHAFSSAQAPEGRTPSQALQAELLR